MDEQTANAVLGEWAAHRVAAMRNDHRRSIAERLLDTRGAVSVTDVDALHVEEWAEPDLVHIQAQVVARAQAQVAYHERELEQTRATIENMRRKVEKFEQLLSQVREQLAAAEAELPERERNVTDSEELLTYALRPGVQALVSDAVTNTHAEVAELRAEGT